MKPVAPVTSTLRTGDVLSLMVGGSDNAAWSFSGQYGSEPAGGQGLALA